MRRLTRELTRAVGNWEMKWGEALTVFFRLRENKRNYYAHVVCNIMGTGLELLKKEIPTKLLALMWYGIV